MNIDKPEFDLEKLASDWAWLINLEDYRLEAISPFGDLLLRDQSDALCLLDINLGSVEYAIEVTDDPAIAFPIAFDDRIAEGYRKAHLSLKPDTCYGYKIPCVTGGSVEVENVYVATLTEYVSFMGSFHFQIKDVDDGESVIIKVVRPSVN